LLALPREPSVSNAINDLEKGLGETRCVTFQCVSGSPPKPFSLIAPPPHLGASAMTDASGH